MSNGDETHPSVDLDDVVHQRVRLGILAVLNEAPKADFGELRSLLKLTDGNLSRHLTVLEDATFVEQEKVFEGKRPKTWVSITAAGKQAFADEVAALRALLSAVDR
jgi:DNA-binding MarR family transcriptional regulator